MNQRFVRGKLVPTNTDAANNSDDRRALYHAFKENQLHRLIVLDSTWYADSIDFYSSTPVSGARDEAMSFIRSLDQIMKTEAAAKFGFNGYFTVVIETGAEPAVFQATIKDGQLFYQEAEHTWTKLTTL